MPGFPSREQGDALPACRYDRRNEFFTVNLTERHSDLWVRHIEDVRTITHTEGERGASVCRAGDGCVDRTPARHLASAAGRCRLSVTLVTDQGGVFSVPAKRRAHPCQPQCQTGTWLPGNGAIGNIKFGMRPIWRACGLHSLQPRQARFGHSQRCAAALNREYLRRIGVCRQTTG